MAVVSRIGRITAVELAALAAALVAVVLLGTGLGVAAVRIERGPGQEGPLRIRPAADPPPMLNRDRQQLEPSAR